MNEMNERMKNINIININTAEHDSYFTVNRRSHAMFVTIGMLTMAARCYYYMSLSMPAPYYGATILSIIYINDNIGHRFVINTTRHTSMVGWHQIYHHYH